LIFDLKRFITQESKVKKRLLVSVLSLAAVACSSRGGKQPTASEIAAGGDSRVLPTVSHKVTECPELNGEYVNKDDEKRMRVIKTEATETGLVLIDTDLKWIADGKKQSAEGPAQVSYLGSCERQAIIIDLYQGSTQIGRMAYRLSDDGQLVLDMKHNDLRMGPDKIETWVPKH
jgi:hypothetical protein